MSKGATSAPVYPALPTYAPSTLNNRCVETGTTTQDVDPSKYTPQPCDDDLTCIFKSSTDTFGICRRSLYGTCNTIYDCVPQANVCNGTCINGSFGAFGQECNPGGVCGNNFSCTSDNICLISNGGTGCVSGADCITDRCIMLSSGIMTCTDSAPIASSCYYTNFDPTPCGENVCVSGICQPSGVTYSGGPGALCTIPGTYTGLTCYPYLFPYPECAYDINNPTSDGYGRCQANIAGIGEACGIDTAACEAPTICTSGICTLPTDNSGYYSQDYKCNVSGSSIGCTTGYTCQFNNCSAIPEGICLYSTDCLSGSCGNLPALMRWTPGDNSLGTWDKIMLLSDVAMPGIGANISSYQNDNSNLLIYLPNVNSINFYIININTLNVCTVTLNLLTIVDSVPTNSNTLYTIKGVKYVFDGTIAVHYNNGNNDSIYLYNETQINPDNVSSYIMTPIIQEAYSYDIITSSITNTITDSTTGTPIITSTTTAGYTTMTSVTSIDTTTSEEVIDKDAVISYTTSIPDGSTISNVIGIITTFDFFDVTPTTFGFGSINSNIIYYGPTTLLNASSSITNSIDMSYLGWSYFNPVLYMKFNSDISFMYSLMMGTSVNSTDKTIKYNSTQAIAKLSTDTSIDIYSPTNGGMYLYGFDVNFGPNYPEIVTSSSMDSDSEIITKNVANILGGYSVLRNGLTVSPPNAKPLITNPLEPNPTNGDPYFIPGKINAYNYTNIESTISQISSLTTPEPLLNIPYKYPITMGVDKSMFIIGTSCN